jgi:hypothetical protein
VKTRLINLRVNEVEFERIKRVSAATHMPVTDMIRNGLAMLMRAMASGAYAGDPLEQAFTELLSSGKVSALSPGERGAAASYKARKASGKLKTISAADVLTDLKNQ